MNADNSRTGADAHASTTAIQRKAAEWLALRHARRLTLSEEADFADWRDRDPRHSAIYSEVEGSWRAFDVLAEYPHSPDSAPDPDLLARPRPTIRFVAPSLLAAAAAIAVMAALWFKPRQAAEVDQAPVALAQTEPSLVRLPDGSEVEVNAGGEVREEFTPDERRVRLVRGEAHFIVAKNPARPFIVEANGVAVRAIGTAFNVRFRQEAGAVEVLVTEGTVRVAPPPATGSSVASADMQSATGNASRSSDDTAILTAGQRIVVSSLASSVRVAPVVETLAPAAVDHALSWQTGRLILDATPLAEVVERFNRHAAGRAHLPHLIVADPQLGKMKISGRIRPENIESFVEALETNFDVAVERRAGNEIVLKPR